MPEPHSDRYGTGDRHSGCRPASLVFLDSTVQNQKLSIEVYHWRVASQQIISVVTSIRSTTDSASTKAKPLLRTSSSQEDPHRVTTIPCSAFRIIRAETRAIVSGRPRKRHRRGRRQCIAKHHGSTPRRKSLLTRYGKRASPRWNVAIPGMCGPMSRDPVLQYAQRGDRRPRRSHETGGLGRPQQAVDLKLRTTQRGPAPAGLFSCYRQRS